MGEAQGAPAAIGVAGASVENLTVMAAWLRASCNSLCQSLCLTRRESPSAGWTLLRVVPWLDHKVQTGAVRAGLALRFFWACMSAGVPPLSISKSWLVCTKKILGNLVGSSSGAPCV